jgi:5-formyltetrahydrofolate cyclo-ligase
MNSPDARAWRKVARAKLIGARIAVPAALHARWTEDLTAALRPILAESPRPISFYWPFKAEPDLRPIMRELDAEGAVVALPVATRLGEPMTFRPWRRGAPMERGIWDIPIPATTEQVVPKTVIAPIVGFDGENFRLGYGGGFFDRTLARIGPEARAIGVGFSLFRLTTIHPQDHDIAMARIVTEAMTTVAGESASPVCYANEGDPVYGGFLSDADLALELEPLAGILPPERLPLLELALWQLARPAGRGGAQVAPAKPVEHLSRLLPRIRGDGIHAAVRVLRDSLDLVAMA